MRRAEPPVRYDDSVLTLLSLATTADAPAVDAHFSNLLDLVAQNKPATQAGSRLHIMNCLQDICWKVSPATRQRAAHHVSRMPVALPSDVVSLLITMSDGADRLWLDHARLTPQAWSSVLPKLAMHEVRRIAMRHDLPASIALLLRAIRPTPLLLPAPAVVIETEVAVEAVVPVDIEEASDEILDLTPTPSMPANDAEPMPQVAAFSNEEKTNSQVKSLLERIAWFRQRPTDKPFIQADGPLGPDMGQAEPVGSDVSASTADSLFLLQNPLAFTPSPSEDVAAELPSPSSAAEQVNLPALLADWFWETDRNGMFVFAGQNVSDKVLPASALPSLKGQYLVDWLAASPQLAKTEAALRRRTSFHQVQLKVNDGAFAGDWLLSAVAAFDRKTGVFLGHRGVAQKQPEAVGVTEGGTMPEALATAAHETRTPLNAIMGFAQMIETQPYGPVSAAYTAQADAILDASNRLLRALDDVSETTRLDRGLVHMHGTGFSLEPMVEALLAQLQPTIDRRSVRFELRVAAGIPSLWSDRDIVERCIMRLAIALISVAASGEVISVHVREAASDQICIAFSKPVKLRDVPDAELMKPVQSGQNEQPRLNIGFALRLVERLASVVGGDVRVGITSIDLLLPAVPALAAAQEARGH